MRGMKRALFAGWALAASLSSGAVLGDEAFERALSLAAEKRYSEAREALDPLLLREPGEPRARLLHGVLRAREGRVGEAIEVFEALRREFPDMSEPHNNLAVLHALEGRLEEARTTLLAMLERRPDAVVYANLGDVYTKLARRAYERARELEAGGGARPEPETDTALASPAARDHTAATGARDGVTASKQAVTESKQAVTESKQAVTEPRQAVTESKQAVTEPRQAVTEPKQAVTEPRGAATESATYPRNAASKSPDSMAGPTESREAATRTVPAASRTAPTPGGFCAHAGGFPDRRAVAEAALWLQAQGAEVLHVRHEEHRVAGSYQVYLPPFENRDEAAAKVREIRGRGVRDVAVIPDGDLANGISFGIYREEDNMHRRVAELDRLGYAVRSHAAGVEVARKYVIKARASGAPATLDTAWSSRFPQRTIRVVDCG